MREVRCIKCGNEVYNIHGVFDIVYYVCSCCDWWMLKSEYDNIVNEVIEKALEEV